MTTQKELNKIIDKSAKGYFDQNLYISRLYKALLPDDLMPELVERIGNFVWALKQLEMASGSSIYVDFDELPKILVRDYSSKAYKRRWSEIESMYRCKDWYLGMIAQLEAEEYVNGQSEV